MKRFAYPQLKKVTDFDLLESLTRRNYDDKNIFVTELYETKSFVLRQIFFAYKRKTIIALTRKDYLLSKQVDETVFDKHEIFLMYKYITEKLPQVIRENAIEGHVSEEVYLTGFRILGTLMQLFFRILHSANTELYNFNDFEKNVYCRTFQASSLEHLRYVLNLGAKHELCHMIDEMISATNHDMIIEELYKYKRSFESNIYMNTLDNDHIYDDLVYYFSHSYLTELYLREVNKLPFVKSMLHKLGFKNIFMPLDEYIDNQYKRRLINSLFTTILDITNMIAYIYNIEQRLIPVNRSKNTNLTKVLGYDINQFKSNKIAINYLTENDIPLHEIKIEYFYLMLNDFNISSNNKLNYDIFTSIFNHYLHNILLEDELEDIISSENIDPLMKQENNSIYWNWMSGYFETIGYEHIFTILKNNHTLPYRTYRRLKQTYAVIGGSQNAYDYYDFVLNRLEILEYPSIKFKKEKH